MFSWLWGSRSRESEEDGENEDGPKEPVETPPAESARESVAVSNEEKLDENAEQHDGRHPGGGKMKSSKRCDTNSGTEYDDKDWEEYKKMYPYEMLHGEWEYYKRQYEESQKEVTRLENKLRCERADVRKFKGLISQLELKNEMMNTFIMSHASIPLNSARPSVPWSGNKAINFSEQP